MLTPYFTVLLLVCSLTVFSQSDSLQNQINEQVWKPFINAINSGDNDALSKVHSKEVARVMQDNNKIIGYSEYFKKVPDSIKAKWSDWKSNIELRFVQRIASAGKAFEVGYYKTTSTNSKTGEKRTGYGKFHVLLRKENGTWKILMDADANEKTDEKVFITAQPIE
jgi:ketosteroid isomerase-like protein